MGRKDTCNAAAKEQTILLPDKTFQILWQNIPNPLEASLKFGETWENFGKWKKSFALGKAYLLTTFLTKFCNKSPKYWKINVRKDSNNSLYPKICFYQLS